jgi:hypothetical protein
MGGNFMTTYSRWATADEVEAHLNGEGAEGAAWVLVSGNVEDGDAQFDMTVPLWEEDF